MKFFPKLALAGYLALMWGDFSYVQAAETSAYAQAAAEAWSRRENPGQTEEAIRLWRLAAQQDPTNTDLRIQLAKALGRAVRHAKTPKERKKWADEAKVTAEKATQLSPHNSEAHAVYGEALGQWANARKGIRSLNSVKEAVAALQRAIDLKPDNAYAHMLLAEFYRQAPRVLSVGDKNKAVEEARLAVQYAPSYAINHLILAKALLDKDQKEEAQRELEIILQLTPPSDAIPETRADQETARSMLDMLGSESLSHCAGTGNSCVEKQ